VRKLPIPAIVPEPSGPHPSDQTVDIAFRLAGYFHSLLIDKVPAATHEHPESLPEYRLKRRL
jgi:hypothetical protein